jgi:catechol 2,3-dioxygenase-like lactoylglutathione lyase family enzyme
MTEKRSQYIDTAAVLIVSDLKRSWDWYRDQLGFEVTELDWSVNPRFSFAEREGACVMLREGPEAEAGTPNRELVPEPPIWDAYFWVRDIDKVEAELKRRHTPIYSGPTKMPHGCTEITVLDPDGFLIGFGYCP